MVAPLQSRWELDTGIPWDLRYWPTDPFKAVHFLDDGLSSSRDRNAHCSTVANQGTHRAEGHLRRVRRRKQADEVFVIGYSLPKTDQDQWNFIDSAVRARSVAIPKLTIINYNSPSEYFQDIWSLFRRSASVHSITVR